MEQPTEHQLLAAFVQRFRDVTGAGDEAVVPTGDADVFFGGVVDLPEVLSPLFGTVWAAAYRQGVEDQALAGGDPVTAGRENPYWDPVPLPSDTEAHALLEPEEGPPEDG